MGLFGKKNKQKKNKDQPQLLIYEPTVIKDSKLIAQKLKEGIPVLLDFSSTPPALAVRIVDFVSGMMLALEDAKYERIDQKKFFLAPSEDIYDEFVDQIK
jgi:FtsZ-interacting cell division protein YlmF